MKNEKIKLKEKNKFTQLNLHGPNIKEKLKLTTLGFTLIELLAVIIIMALTFLFVVPEMTNLIKRSEDTTNKLNEEIIIRATKEYVSSNNNLFDTMINVGDVVYILKEDLLNSKIIDKKDVSSLDNFVSVKCELLENDKIKYIVMYE